jgi:hypothetical protein
LIVSSKVSSFLWIYFAAKRSRSKGVFAIIIAILPICGYQNYRDMLGNKKAKNSVLIFDWELFFHIRQ